MNRLLFHMWLSRCDEIGTILLTRTMSILQQHPESAIQAIEIYCNGAYFRYTQHLDLLSTRRIMRCSP